MKVYTPWPWSICRIRGTQDKDNVYVQGDDGELVAAVFAYGPFNPDRIIRGQANARLIAAAPELFEAVELAADIIHDTPNDEGDSELNQVCKKVRAALAKVRCDS